MEESLPHHHVGYIAKKEERERGCIFDNSQKLTKSIELFEIF